MPNSLSALRRQGVDAGATSEDTPSARVTARSSARLTSCVQTKGRIAAALLTPRGRSFYAFRRQRRALHVDEAEAEELDRILSSEDARVRTG